MPSLDPRTRYNSSFLDGMPNPTSVKNELLLFVYGINRPRIMFVLTATDMESIKANETTKVCQFFVYKQSFTRSKDSNLYCFLSRIETEPTRYLVEIIVR